MRLARVLAPLAGLGAGANVTGISACAATSFPECPAVGNDTTGCEFLITVTSASAGIGTNFTVTASVPDLGPFDGSDDTLVGILNGTSTNIGSVSLTSPQDIFGFDGDGACSDDYGPIPGCTGTIDPSGYAPAGVTFSAVNAAQTTGKVSFSPSLAPGGSTWFSLEEALTPSQIMPVNPTPEPSSIILLGIGLGAVCAFLVRRRIAK